MSSIHLRPMDGNSWPPIPDAKFSLVWASYPTLERTQWLKPAEIEQHQLTQARTLLTHCLQHVPYYRELLTKLDIQPSTIRSMNDFRRIPVLPRRTWQEQFDRLAAERLPNGTTALNDDETSGTTGMPVRILKTNLFHTWWFAFYLRDLEWSGTDTKAPMAVIRPSFKKGDQLKRTMQGTRASSWQPMLHPLLETGPRYSMDIQQDQRKQIEWLLEVKPNYLLSYPSNLEALAGILLEEPRSFTGLRGIQAIAETLSDEAKTKIEAAFGAPVRNVYSCTEAGYLASPCPEGKGMHVHSENVILEVLDEQGQPVKPGETGSVYLTVLHNSRSPLIRYEVGDEVTLAQTSCPCGRGLPSIASIWGKRRPLLPLRDGRKKQSTSLAVAISAIGGHHQHQIVQKTLDQVVVRIVPSKSWTAEHPKRIHRALQEFFGTPIHLNVELRERLELPRNGKLLSIISEVPV